MDYVVIIGLFAVLIVGFVVGYFTKSLLLPKEIGRLNLERNNDTGELYMFLEVNKGMKKYIYPGEKVILKVTDESYLNEKWNFTRS